MPFQFISNKIHGAIDYLAAIALIALPFVLELGVATVAATVTAEGGVKPDAEAVKMTAYIVRYLSVAVGVLLLVYSLLTRYSLGGLKLIPFGLHLGIDLLAGVAFIVVAFVLGFVGIDQYYYIVAGAVVIVLVILTNPSTTAGASTTAQSTPPPSGGEG